MTSEQEGAANWQTVEDYKKTRERFHALKARVSRWAWEFVRIGEFLQRSPEEILENYQVNLPTREEFAETASEMRDIKAKYERLSDDLRGLGIEPF
jgi:hypothetical protein